MSDTLDDVARRFVTYLQAKLAPDTEVLSLARIHGGASRETYRARVRHSEGGAMRERGLILRRDPVGSLIDTERDVEFRAYTAFRTTSVPVPAALFLEMDEAWLDRPFFVMEEVEGCAAASPFRVDAFGAVRERVGEQFWKILGRIHAENPEALGLAGPMEAPSLDGCWDRELSYWEGVVDADELEPQPVFRGAVRWLRRNPPPPPLRLSVVHGDYRTGNFLFDEAGEIRAILDWEMCHLGDAHEDLAWALDPLWAFRTPEHPGGLIARDQALRHWERTSNLKVNADALRWWSTFAMVKGLAIWISSGNEYVNGKNQDPVLAFSSWYCTSVHDHLLALRMRELLEGSAV